MISATILRAAILAPLAFLASAALVGCAKQDDGVMQGYGEAEYLHVGPLDAGRISEILVREGDKVEAGAVLFRLDPSRASASARGAEASAAAARSRSERGGALDEAVRRAEAEAMLAARNLQRTEELYRRGFLAAAKLDADRAASRAADAARAQALGEREAASRDAGAAAAQASLERQRLSDFKVTAPAAGSVERMYRRVGEVVNVGDPVMALLPPGNMKIRFFAPESRLAQLPVGTQVTITCDGCKQATKARISFVATEPQFTPPVIYSLEHRQKLSFMLEARPEGPTPIRPGLPVDVRIP